MTDVLRYYNKATTYALCGGGTLEDVHHIVTRVSSLVVDTLRNTD